VKRLLDLPSESRLVSRAHELIRATGPTLPSEARFQQVRRQLDEPALRSPRIIWLRAAIALALVGFGASALALGGSFDRPGPAAPPRVEPRPAPTAIPDTPAQARPTTPAPASARQGSESVPAPAAPAGRRPAPAVGSVSASDVARVHEAARALRGEGNAERALRILESSGEVSGPLAEEALALRIEAASARGDARAAALARSYLARYPGGRYREQAQRALATHGR
jgi:hypothetical protein